MSAPERGRALPELEGDALIRLLLDEIDEEERLSRALGVDLCPPPPDPAHAPAVYGPLAVWIERAEEVHALRERAWRLERRQKGR